ncbi:hypothetical protein NBH20_01600 [Rhizobium sp. S153]|uniref:Uncharacterized protein n=1 Tax=Ciceribacter sichuanensis TaxID=2949647 RepID=A0ABT0V4C9_9HYPH|nr:hypothetical protein [Ciceribacter sp. S153]MCM2399837.1 hypothetical protein [Ciceribacter sp. S153]
MDKLFPFRVHFEDGHKLDISAANAKAATDKAKAAHDGIIRKVKLVRESEAA